MYYLYAIQANVKADMRKYSFQFKVFTISYHRVNMPYVLRKEAPYVH